MAARRYRIGEVAALLGVRTSTLRFLETEFPEARAQRTASGQRYYTEEAVAALRRIKDLVHREGLTLAGARRRLRQEGSAEAEAGLVQELARDLEALYGLLAGRPPAGAPSQGGSHG